MGSAELKYHAAKPASHQEIFRSCREAEMSYHDPTIMHKLALQIAIAEDRFDDACACAPPSFLDSSLLLIGHHPQRPTPQYLMTEELACMGDMSMQLMHTCAASV